MKKDYLLILVLFVASFSFSQEKRAATGQNEAVEKVQEIEGFEIFPNPVSDGILKINSDQNAERTIHIYDVLGKQVFFTTTKKRLINIARLKSGIYIIRVYEQGNTATRKLIIK